MSQPDPSARQPRLQQIHGQVIHLPRRAIDLPDRARLERRYEQFREAAG